MRPQQKSNRNRNKNKRQNMGNVVNRVFDSNGPEGKVRGTPQQIIDKYETLARDAQTSGDRVVAENFLQHAEHYARLLSTAQAEREARKDPGDQPQPDAFANQPQKDVAAADASQPVIDPGEQDQPDLVVDTPEAAEAKPANGSGRGSSRRRSRPARKDPGDAPAKAAAAPAEADGPQPEPQAPAEEAAAG